MKSAGRKIKKQRRPKKRRRFSEGYFYTVPAVLYMLALIGFPAIYNWKISFENMTIKTYNAGTTKFVGLKNYIDLFHDSAFWNAFWNTFEYTIICLVIQFSIGLLLAILFSKKFPMAGKLRGLLVVSWLIPATVTALMFKFMLSSDGIVNFLLIKAGIVDSGIGWLIDPKYAMKGLILANSWVGIPFNMLLLSTGLSNIPEDIYESAQIDGANPIQRFFFITIPLIKSSILAVLVLGFVYTFKVFDLVYTMTNGGPVNSTEVLSTYAYYNSFKLYEFGKGAAVANVLFVILFLVGLIYLRLIGKEE
ncbi:MAG: sugar ABC transporter permease [Eubacteriales bacterium]|nr:sugar ABC transporter permease [Eubacteriales bacterium]